MDVKCYLLVAASISLEHITRRLVAVLTHQYYGDRVEGSDNLYEQYVLHLNADNESRCIAKMNTM